MGGDGSTKQVGEDELILGRTWKLNAERNNGRAISSWAALPTAAWFQIVIFISFCEINFLKQDPNKEPGDVVPEGIPWARYPDGYDVWLGDGSTKQVGEDELILGRKLNAERNNGRAAMMGIPGMLIHEAL